MYIHTSILLWLAYICVFLAFCLSAKKKYFLLFKEDKNGHLIFDFFGSDLSKMDQTWSIWISQKSKNVIIKSCHTNRKYRDGCWIFDFFGSDLSKMDQTWSIFLARNGFLAVMAFLQKLLFVQKHLCQIWNGFLAQKRFFSNESALLLKALKGLARLWWLKAFRLVLCTFL